MRTVNQVFSFYLNSSIHVALSVFALMHVTELYFGLTPNTTLNYFVFFAAISGYNFVKYFGIAKFHHRSLTTNLKVIQIFSFVCTLAALYCASQLSFDTLLLFVPFGVVTILYAIPFLSGFQKSLRTISYLKIIVVALVWVGSTVLLPILDAQKSLEPSVYLYGVQRFLLVIVLILPFDIRDLKYDAVSLHTIPQKIGIQNTKKLGFVLLVFMLVIEFLVTQNLIFRNVFLGFTMVILFFLMRANKEQSRYYSSFWVESLPIFWWLTLLVL